MAFILYILYMDTEKLEQLIEIYTKAKEQYDIVIALLIDEIKELKDGDA